MSVQLGSKFFDGMLGPGPELARVKSIIYVRPGITHVGARVQPGFGVESEITLVRTLAEASRISEQLGYRAILGTVVAFIDGTINYTTTYSFNFIVLDVMIEESRRVHKAVGIDPGGTAFDLAPAGRIVSKWRLISIPSA